MKLISEIINELNIEKVYPFHMPGHKRAMIDRNPYLIDITEIDGYDNLHNPTGMIKELEERISRLYKADRSYVLVNGSTGGILAALSAVTNYGDYILMARNSHKAAYNAVCIRGLKADYIYPEYIECPGINGSISLRAVEDMLNESRERNIYYKVVYITSPTYEGVVSDIEKIAALVHEYGAYLIVDEAHGAHLGLSSYFPKSAINCNADIVIQSIHKTLMGMTQTAVLHASRNAPIEKIEYYLRVYQSSSPSYVLMSSVDNCINMLEEDNKRKDEGDVSLWKSYRQRLERLYSASSGWKDIAVFSQEREYRVDKERIFDYDCGKLVIYSRSRLLSGKEIYDILRKKYKLQLEMSLKDYCLAMTSCMDNDEGYERLIMALEEIDNELTQARKQMKLSGRTYNNRDKRDNKDNLDNINDITSNGHIIGQQHADRVCTIAQAFERDKSEIELKDGMVVGDYCYVYPPGIPFIVPGERVTNEIIYDIIKAENAGYEVHGVSFRNGRPYMKVISSITM